MSEPPHGLLRLVAEESASRPSDSIIAVAEAARRRCGPGIAAVLFYGSCLRLGDDEGKIVDLYLLAERYAAVHRNPLTRGLNALLPPNVYYLETPFGNRTVRAKYAIVSLRQFERLVSRRTLQSYFWARFTQPTTVLWARDPTVEERLHRALAEAMIAMVSATLPLLPPGSAPDVVWQRAFAETYRTELRAERPEQAARLYRAFAERYDRVTELVRGQGIVLLESRDQARRRWRRRRVIGKLLSIARLLKAGFTFADGASYLAWKIRRHAGVEVELTPWQRRHPILASSILAWRLYRAGGFR